MTIPVADLEAGKCYLAKGEKVSQGRRVLQVMPDGRVRFERRTEAQEAPHGLGCQASRTAGPLLPLLSTKSSVTCLGTKHIEQ